MEESQGEPGHPESDSQTQTDKSLKNTWRDKAKNLPLKYKIGAAGTALVALAGGAVGINKAAEGDNQTDSNVSPTPVERTIEPTTVEPTQVVEITPTPIEATPNPIPAITPVETPTPTQEVTPAPETEIPKNYDIIDKGILNPDHPAYELITTENSIKVIDSFFENYPALSHPQFGKLKIQIYLGGGSRYNQNEHIIVMDRAAYDFKDDFLHELVHSWDYATTTNNEIVQVRNEILNSPQTGRHYPDIETLMNSRYEEAAKKFSDPNTILTINNLRELASLQADGFWIREDTNDPLSGYFMDQSLQNKEGHFDSVNQFLEDPQVKNVVETNKYWGYMDNIIKGDPQKWENYVSKIYPFIGTENNAQDMVKALTSTGRLILMEKLMTQDPQMSELFSSEQIRLITLQLESRKNRADGEMLAEVMSKWMLLTEQNRLDGQDNNINRFITSIKSQ